MASDGAPIAGGLWQPPGSSQERRAELIEDDAGRLTVLAQGQVATSAVFERVEISPRVGSIPRRLVFPDGSVFETGDNDALDGWLHRRRGSGSGWLHRLEAFHPRLIAVALAVILLTVGIYRYALPVMVEVAVVVTPPFVPEMIGSGALSSLDTTVFSPSKLGDGERERIAAGFAGIAARADGGEAAYRLNFRDGGALGANAFALPDGNLVLTDGLVALAGGDLEMLLAVLAHEIGHVEHKHSLRQIYRAAGLAALVMLIAGDVGAGVEDILTQGTALVTLSYSRAAETEADRRSVELMHAAGRDAAALARLFALLQGAEGGSGGADILSTHPGHAERRDDILSYAAELGDRR